MTYLKMTLFFIKIWMSFFLLESVCAGTRKKVDLMYSKERTEPNTFWPVMTSMQDFNSSSSSVLMHGVSVVSPGPTVEATPLDALQFTGSSMSYLEIPNTDNNFNGTNAMCWEFYLYYEESQDSVLLEYEGTVGGIQLRLVDTGLKAIIHTSSGHVFEHHVYDKLDPFIWRIVGINFNKNWKDYEFDIFTISDPSSEQVDETIMETKSYAPEIILDAVGSIRIGQDHHGNSSFKGRMSCFQFYDISIYKKTSYESGLWCDPAIWDPGFTGDGMRFAEKFTTFQIISTIPTTMQTETSKILTSEKVEASTTQRATDTQRSSQITEDTTHMESTIKDQTTWSSTVATSFRRQTTTESVTAPLAQPTAGYEPPIYRCMHFRRIDNAVLVGPFATLPGSDLKECVESCIRSNVCVVFSVENTDCHIGTYSSNVIFSIGDGMRFAEKFTTFQIISTIPTTMQTETSKILTSEKVEASTTQLATDTQRSSQITEDTTHMESTIKDQTTWSSTVATSFRRQTTTESVTAPLAQPTAGYGPPLNRCMHFRRIDNAVLVCPFATLPGSDLKECVESCIRSNVCVVFSVENTDCHIGTYSSNVIFSIGNSVFQLK